MGVEKLLEKAKTRFSLDDVQNGEVETVSVIAVDEPKVAERESERVPPRSVARDLFLRPSMEVVRAIWVVLAKNPSSCERVREREQIKANKDGLLSFQQSRCGVAGIHPYFADGAHRTQSFGADYGAKQCYLIEPLGRVAHILPPMRNLLPLQHCI